MLPKNTLCHGSAVLCSSCDAPRPSPVTSHTTAHSPPVTTRVNVTSTCIYSSLSFSSLALDPSFKGNI